MAGGAALDEPLPRGRLGGSLTPEWRRLHPLNTPEQVHKSPPRAERNDADGLHNGRGRDQR